MSVNNETPTITFCFDNEEDEYGGQFMSTMLPRVGDRVTVGDSEGGRDEMKERTGVVTEVNWTFTFHYDDYSKRARQERWVAVCLKETDA
jgi:hypothetical protein